jgi:tyrosine-protein kinase Etk/Wzc
MADDDLVSEPSKSKILSPQERSPFKVKPLSEAESGGADQYSKDTDEISLLDVLIVLAKHKKLIIGLPFLAAVVTAGITLLMPNWYTATAKLLPPQQSQSNAVAILGQLGALGGASQALGIKNPSDIFVSMLKSRTVSDVLIQKFELQKVYDEDTMMKTREKLADYTNLTASKDGVITIEVEDKDPKRATAIANAYVGELRGLTLNFAIGEAGQRRLFFETRLTKAKDDLSQAEVQLKKFQQQTGLISPMGQAGLTVSAAAGLRAQITAREVQLSAMRTFATENNPDIQRIQQEISGLRSEMARMDKNNDIAKGDVLTPVGKAPEVGLEFIRKYRDVKYYETLFELLAKQYEIARIDEAKDATLIQVLDVAVPPDRKSRPKRALIILLASLVAAILAVFAAFTFELWGRFGNSKEGKWKRDQLQKLISIARP